MDSSTPSKGAIGIVHRDIGFVEMWHHLPTLKSPTPLTVLTQTGTSIARMRNEVVKRALELNMDWVLFIDDDHMFPPDALTRLLNHNVPIVGGLYLTRSQPYRTTAGIRLESGLFRSLAPHEFMSGDLLPVDGLGLGFTLIRRVVFDAVPFPWFKVGTIDPAELTEDTNFLIDAKAKGFQAYLDTGLRIPHLRVMAVMVDTDGNAQFVEPSLTEMAKAGIPLTL